MADTDSVLTAARARLAWPVLLTRGGLFCEGLLRAFWPLVSIVLVALAALMLGLQDSLAVETVWVGGLATVAGAIWALARGTRRFRWPTEQDALDRLDRTLPGRPIAAIADSQAVGAGDAGSERVWAAHITRMAERAKAARAVAPNLRLAARDPFALRYAALLAFVVALVFGSVLRVASVAEMTPGGGAALASGPAWEGWIEPPAYTGKPSLYLNDIDRASLDVPHGSRITLRLYGEIGALAVAETVSGRTGELPPASDPAHDFRAMQDGTLGVEGPGGRSWEIRVVADTPPEIAPAGPLERVAGGEFELPFEARDDYGVAAARAEMALDLDRVDRRYGLAPAPETRAAVVLDLPMTISGDRSDFDETLVDNLERHPWAGLPVTLRLVAEDDAGQTGASETQEVILPARRFFDPLAAAVVEQRRDLLWSRDNARRVARVLRAVSHRPEQVFTSETAYLKLRVAIRRLETAARLGRVPDALQAETAEALWDIAVMIEEGDLADALERLRRAQDRLAEAIENGATDQEIAELMQEMREAMQDYMRQLAEQSGEQDQQQAQGETQEITGDQLEQMLQRLQELMQQGRTEEAMALLEQLRQMMENMQVAQGQQGQGQSPGQQAMEGLAETLREQQGLSDEAFRDLQRRFGQEGQQGQGGQSPEGEQPDRQSLADRQQALRDELQRQQQGLPGAGTEGGEAAREALDRAGRAMEGAEEALRDEDFAGALDDQSEAIEALREGMRELGEELANQQGQQGRQGDQFGNADPNGRRDPLGRDQGTSGRLGTDEELLRGEDIYRRARDLLDEIRRRSGDQTRPEIELDYLRRLLDRF